MLQDELALNLRHLGIVLNKSKSTINDIFKKMRYDPVTLTAARIGSLTIHLPQLASDSGDLNCWSIRQRRSVVPRSVRPGDMEPEGKPSYTMDVIHFEPDWFSFPELSIDTGDPFNHSVSRACHVTVPFLSRDNQGNQMDGHPFTELINVMIIRQLVDPSVEERESYTDPGLALWE
jgi:hypothetical protein